MQGKSAALAKKIIDDAKALEKAGAFAILLEMVPDRLCKLITERAENCIIMSLGSGPHAHGQLLIYHDMFGLYPKFKPKMAKVFGNAGEVILNGLKSYHDEVTGKQFPQPENWFGMQDEEYDELIEDVGVRRIDRYTDNDCVPFFIVNLSLFSTERSTSMTDNLRQLLAIPNDRLDAINDVLLDPESQVMKDFLAVVAKYGTPEEINRKARRSAQAGEPAQEGRRQATRTTSRTWSG